jgi:translocation and assembly module TamB
MAGLAMRWLRRLLWLLLALLALTTGLFGVVVALARSEAATAQLLQRLPGVQVVGAQGALWGDFRASRVDIALPRQGRLTLHNLSWQDLRVRPQWQASWLLGIEADRLAADKLTLVWVADPASQGPMQAPQDLSLPVSLYVRHLLVGEVRSSLWGDEPMQGLDAALALQRSSGVLQQRHELVLRQLRWSSWRMQGQGAIEVHRRLNLTMALQARLDAGASPQTSAPAADVSLRVQGPLANLAVQGSARLPRSGEAPADLTLSGRVAPFAAWPLPSLDLQGQNLDLAMWHASLPRTRLQGRVQLQPVQSTLRADIDLRNDAAGPWGQGGLPVKTMKGHVVVPDILRAQDLLRAGMQGDVALDWSLPALPGHPDAKVALRGGWGGQKALAWQWRGLQPQALWHAAPALMLQGESQWRPTWATLAAARQPSGDWRSVSVGLTASVSGQFGPSFQAPELRKQRPLRSQADIPVSLALDGAAGRDFLQLKALRAEAAGALAALRETRLNWSQPAPAPDWSVKGHIQVQAFDPQVWLPWPAGVSGGSRLTGEADVALDARWRGRIDLSMAPSVLAGVPLSGTLQWASPQARSRMSLQTDLHVAGNALTASADVPWTMDAQGRPRWLPDASWEGRIQAPALAALQPLAPLLGAHQIQGVIEGSFKGHGVWPQLSTTGELTMSSLRWLARDSQRRLSLNAARANWSLQGMSNEAPLRLEVDLKALQSDTVSVDQARWSLTGTLKSHQSRLSLDVAHQGRSGKTTRLHLQHALQGSWQPANWTWQGRVGELALNLDGATPRSLLSVAPFGLSWREAPQGRQVKVEATTLSVLGAGLHLRQLDWQVPADHDALGELHVALDLDPLNLPALLTAWQPQAGWGGDLVVEGQLRLRHSAKTPWMVDMSVARQAGDLTLSETTVQGNSAQRLGIRDARLNLQARDGLWTLTEQLDGRLLGLLKGRQTVRAASPHALPAAQDPFGGELDFQVANLRPLGTWLPAGWRLGGQMQVSAQLGGTLGAPQYTGRVRGRDLALGQALLGINLSGGSLALDLDGDALRLNEFSALSGPDGGRITAKGSSSVSAPITMQLQVQAERFALLQRFDRRVVISGDLKMGLDDEAVLTQGQLQVDEGLIDISHSEAPTIGDDVNVVHRPGQVDEEVDESATAAPGSRRKFNTDINVDLGHRLRLRGKGLDAILAGKLKLSTPSNRPALQGTIKVENGTFAAYGQKLVIDRGDIAFTGAVDNPRLDILAMRPQSPTASASDVKVGVAITGTAQDPRVRLYSDPAMSETEKLSWLVLGRAPTGLGGADIGLLQSAAVALLSGEGSGPSDNLVTMLGLDELSVRQQESAGTVRDTVVNLGKQVSKYWYVGYERNLNATSGNWQLIYRLAQRFTVRAQAGDDNAVDFIWSWRWN